ncbi:MAG: sorbosone dehydrogenase family protein [Spirochaetales bacterium]|nr:sorbosone dehydrogenase family protein [Spirochaetales bacterium]
MNIKLFIIILLFFTTIVYAAGENALPLDTILLPAGFHIEIYYYPVPGARSLSLGKNGTVFVGTREKKVYAITDIDNDYKGDSLFTIASGLFMPNGVAFFNDSLYVAEVNRVLRFDDIEKNLKKPPQPVVINNTFPDDRHHGWKFIAFGPDKKLYIPVGAPCNVCEREDKRYASIMRMEPDGTGLEIFAAGIRNTVGFDWNPETKELWFTDNGRDLMGDNVPPDELNRAWKKGLHFGFPYIHGKSIPDPQFKAKDTDFSFIPPEIELGPHVAALGMRFYTGKMFPEKYKNQIFIAEHGSWNRTIPIGYRVSLVEVDNNKAVSYTTFAQGWLKDGSSWGRPVDILWINDGSMLVSDDKAGVIYRIYYKK